MSKTYQFKFALVLLLAIAGVLASENAPAQFHKTRVTNDFTEVLDYLPTIDTDNSGDPHVTWVRGPWVDYYGMLANIWYSPGPAYSIFFQVSSQGPNQQFWYNSNPSIAMEQSLKHARIVWEHATDYEFMRSGLFDILYSDNATLPFPNAPTLVGQGREPSISVDGLNVSHIVFENSGTILYCTGSAPPFSPLLAVSQPRVNNQHASINTDAGGQAFIAWDVDDTQIVCAELTGSVVTTLQNVTQGVQPSIFMDSQNFAHITYQYPGGSVHYINNIGGSWSTPLLIDRIGDLPHITVDIYDNVHITYRKNGAVYYTTNASGVFATPTIWVDMGNLATVDRAIIDPFGKIYITYWSEEYWDVWVADTLKPEITWFYKPGYPDYAPFGLPDFDQKQHYWKMPDIVQSHARDSVWTYDAPAALANCLWWWDSRLEAEGISDKLLMPYGPWDDHDTSNVKPFIEHLAQLFHTDSTSAVHRQWGTEIHDIRDGVNSLLMDRGLDDVLYVHLDTIPAFNVVAKELRRCQDVILLLGFYVDTVRIGGHYVTLAGICANDSIGISDPYLDRAEGDIGLPPRPHSAYIHNDAALISGPHGTDRHDRYEITFTPAHPNGKWGVKDYPLTPSLVDNFSSMNLPKALPCTWGRDDSIATQVQVEYALFISPYDSLLGSIRGRKLNDVNGDSLHNPGEPGVEGWTIYIKGTTNSGINIQDEVKTDHLGRFLFGGLQPGTYTITEERRPDWQQTFGIRNPIYLSPMAHITGLEFGNYYLPGSIQGAKFNDLNGDSVLVSKEPGIGGWKFFLYEKTATGKILLDTVRTDARGNFTFSGLKIGSYILEEEIQSGWIQTVGITNPLVLTAVNTHLGHLNFGNHDTTKTTPVYGDASLFPEKFGLLQNYPNPFNPLTTITYRLPENCFVRLKIYDILGREIHTLVEKHQDAGEHHIRLDASQCASGIYFYRIQAGSFTAMKKMIYMR
ncbi:T9SS type A sorting domain-containing protein [candidate division KSB1 bacterium]|nr:T9SS type A sorting domain-containing protein [candidate division KSB1 bacterium]